MTGEMFFSLVWRFEYLFHGYILALESGVFREVS
jgi:hypothetical protein